MLDAEQRLWRTLTRAKYQRTRDKVRLQDQLKAVLEEAHIKLSSLVSDLLGASARRKLKALAEGENEPAALAALADQRLAYHSNKLEVSGMGVRERVKRRFVDISPALYWASSFTPPRPLPQSSPRRP